MSRPQANRIVVTGTDTDIGKTVFAAGLAGLLGARYWKPVQAGMEGGGDAARVAELSGLPSERIHPEAYRLQTPCSPHQAAAIDRVAIDPALLDPPQGDGPLVIEGAGGVLVPLGEELLYADLFARWNCPTILVASTGLGTINHSLLSLEALRARDVPVAGIAFVGEANTETERIICTIGQVRRLGRLPWLEPLNRDSLAQAMAESFDRELLP